MSSPKVVVSDSSNLTDGKEYDCYSSTGPEVFTVVESASDESNVMPPMVTVDADVGPVPLVSPAVKGRRPSKFKAGDWFRRKSKA